MLMPFNNDEFFQVRIPVLMISYQCMIAINITYPASQGYIVQIKVSPGYYDLFRYLIPFVVVVGFCFIVLLISLAIRLCRERRRVARKRLSKRNLRKIPTKKFRKGDEPETCAICLDDFIEGEKLRVLPCRHTNLHFLEGTSVTHTYARNDEEKSDRKKLDCKGEDESKLNL
ncbi:hypothetical protein COOONC_04668 [Cooperia oncophora]